MTSAPPGDDVLAQLAGASPRRLLEDLARTGVALAKSERARPEVEVYLASGPTVRGRIVAVVEDRQGAVAILQVGGSVRAPTVTFIRVDQLAAVTVVDASLLVRAPLSDAPAPSRLELDRQLAARGDALAAGLGRRVALTVARELDDDGRRAVGAVVPVLAEVLLAIAADEMGREALAGLDAIDLTAAARGEVAKQGARGLVVRAPTLLTEQFTPARLREAIEKQL